ncbi:MAG: Rne/Rng family ribonuclease [candidate division Zixibacteria bacterium]|nr:Rne/Rng family ribonuclease [candidate division Zixibacteria bacterium]
MDQQIIVNADLHETRIAIMEYGKLVELLVERPDEERNVGAIYKGKVAAVLPGMQAAFVELGLDRTAFLHISDVGFDSSASSRYDFDLMEDDDSAGPELIRKHKGTPIEKLIKKDQDILVQVIKEPLGQKGARISTSVSLPGRFIVLVPNERHVRVSRKITNWNERKRLRKLLFDLKPDGFGVIIRTEAANQPEKILKKDLKRLLKFWNRITKKYEKNKPPELLHKDVGITSSIIRDYFSEETNKLVVDSKDTYKKIMSYVRGVAPHLKDRVEFYKGNVPIFDVYRIEQEIDKMLERKVWIKKGAYLIIDQTEAMVTIDVNTGRFVGTKDQENTILKVNMESAREIARQIRLRDIGGLIIMDFIDMYNRENRRRLYEEFKGLFKNDRAKNSILPVSDFGLIEMTRERSKPSLLQAFSIPCPTCQGLGRVYSPESVVMKIERWFARAKAGSNYKKFDLVVHPNVGEILNGDRGRNKLKDICRKFRFKINLETDDSLFFENYKIISHDEDMDITEMFKTKAERAADELHENGN